MEMLNQSRSNVVGVMMSSRVSLQIALFLILYIVGVAPSFSFAQEKADDHKRKHTLNFEDELIEGDIQKPELMYLLQRKNFNFKKLIRLREHFLPEMVETGEMIRGTGE